VIYSSRIIGRSPCGHVGIGFGLGAGIGHLVGRVRSLVERSSGFGVDILLPILYRDDMDPKTFLSKNGPRKKHTIKQAMGNKTIKNCDEEEKDDIVDTGSGAANASGADNADASSDDMVVETAVTVSGPIVEPTLSEIAQSIRSSDLRHDCLKLASWIRFANVRLQQANIATDTLAIHHTIKDVTDFITSKAGHGTMKLYCSRSANKKQVEAARIDIQIGLIDLLFYISLGSVLEPTVSIPDATAAALVPEPISEE
jgi:hypothetical protein